MSNYQEVACSEEKRERIARYLMQTQSYTDKQYFQGKCLGACHLLTDLTERSRSMEEWNRLVKRLERRCPLHLGPLESEQILAHLSRVEAGRTEAKRTGEKGQAREMQRIFEEKCGYCHVLVEIIEEYEPTEEVWRPILDRMGDKAPAFLSKAESLSIEPYIFSLYGKDLRKEFPHSFVFHDPGVECN